jgi:aldose 1-epimerase
MTITKPGVLKTTVWHRADRGNEPVVMIVLQNRDITVECTNLGCAITAIYTPDSHLVKKNIVAGFTNWELYTINKDYLGCVVGRYANRIGDGAFNLNGKKYQLTVNDGPNHLHGGWNGFSRKVWQLADIIENENECGVVFTYASADGEEGYPGNLQVTVQYVLNSKRQLHILYRATTDKSTPVNFTNHSYFNLTGFETPTILKHCLQVMADGYTEKSDSNVPTGIISSVCNSALDFTIPRWIGMYIDCFPRDMGYDHNFILNHTHENGIVKAAVLSEETTGRVLTVYTDAPAMQVYTANHWNGSVTGKQGLPYQQYGGVALETQAYPNSVNHQHFQNTILHPGEEYTSTTIFEFGVEGNV